MVSPLILFANLCANNEHVEFLGYAKNDNQQVFHNLVD